MNTWMKNQPLATLLSFPQHWLTPLSPPPHPSPPQMTTIAWLATSILSHSKVASHQRWQVAWRWTPVHLWQWIGVLYSPFHPWGLCIFIMHTRGYSLQYWVESCDPYFKLLKTEVSSKFRLFISDFDTVSVKGKSIFFGPRYQKQYPCTYRPTYIYTVYGVTPTPPPLGCTNHPPNYTTEWQTQGGWNWFPALW